MYNFHLKICCFLIHSSTTREYNIKEENKRHKQRGIMSISLNINILIPHSFKHKLALAFNRDIGLIDRTNDQPGLSWFRLCWDED